MSTAPVNQTKNLPTHSDIGRSAWCPRQHLNLRPRLRRPGALVYCGVSGALPERLPDHLCLPWPPCRVVESTSDFHAPCRAAGTDLIMVVTEGLHAVILARDLIGTAL